LKHGVEVNAGFVNLDEIQPVHSIAYRCLFRCPYLNDNLAIITGFKLNFPYENTGTYEVPFLAGYYYNYENICPFIHYGMLFPLGRKVLRMGCKINRIELGIETCYGGFVIDFLNSEIPRSYSIEACYMF
jgi:hypothetical protein